MRAGHVRRRLTVVCKPRAMRAGHARRRLSVVHRPRPMRPNPWLMPPDVGRRRLPDAPTCHVRCAQAWLMLPGPRRGTPPLPTRPTCPFAIYLALDLADIPKNLYSDIGDEGKPRPTSTERCVQAKGDEGRPRPTSNERCVQAKGDEGKPRPTSTDRCVQAKGDEGRPRPMLPDIGRRRLPDAHMPLQCAQALADAAWHRPWNAPAAYIDPHSPWHLT
ncbi:hypothetical protein KY289_013328 [Solanum tuberosum]|nr:hypothetical protein KY289_013328 [Solanum tuberosum]